MIRMLAPCNGLASGRSSLQTAFACAALLLLSARSTVAQEKPAQKPLPPEVVSLKTTDEKTLSATYYPSRAGKEAAAVILLHVHGGDRTDLDTLACALQLSGSAVIVPDLRGHGDSTLGIKDLRADDYADMVRRDLESVKGFLMQQHNDGKLNIERLGIVGVEMGSTLALNWAVLDWSWPRLATGKQGQDVKALALISPEWTFKGMRINEAVVDPAVRSELSLLIITGRRNARLLSESKRLYNALARFHDVSPSQPIEKKTLFYEIPATSLQGMALLNEKSLAIQQMIVEFVDLRLIKPSLPWELRKPPL